LSIDDDDCKIERDLQAEDINIEEFTQQAESKVGDGQIYTFGTIGSRRVVCIKIPHVGDIADNVITDKLLGMFKSLQHVFIVGVGGSIPHFHDDKQHVRLGDVVVSCPSFNCGPMYIYCNGTEVDDTGRVSYSQQSWNTKNDLVENVLNSKLSSDNGDNPDWNTFLNESLSEIRLNDTRFYRPASETDRLFQTENGVISEAHHPAVASDSPRSRYPSRPIIYHGLVGSGASMNNEENRQAFSQLNELKAIDCGLLSVLNSIEDNSKDSFVVIRGIADYTDGLDKREWQPYASLAAAAYAKSIILSL